MHFMHLFDGDASPGDYTNGYTTFTPGVVNYNAGYTAQQPLGTLGTISLNGLTGYTTMSTSQAGDYVVGIKVTEIDKKRGKPSVLCTENINFLL